MVVGASPDAVAALLALKLHNTAHNSTQLQTQQQLHTLFTTHTRQLHPLERQTWIGEDGKQVLAALLINTSVKDIDTPQLVHLILQNLQETGAQQVVLLCSLPLHRLDDKICYYEVHPGVDVIDLKECQPLEGNMAVGDQLVSHLVSLLRITKIGTTLVAVQKQGKRMQGDAVKKQARHIGTFLASRLHVGVNISLDSAAVDTLELSSGGECGEDDYPVLYL